MKNINFKPTPADHFLINEIKQSIDFENNSVMIRHMIYNYLLNNLNKIEYKDLKFYFVENEYEKYLLEQVEQVETNENELKMLMLENYYKNKL